MTDSAQKQAAADSSIPTLVSSIVFNGGVTLGILTVFCFVRRWNDKVYQPRTYLVPKNKRSPLMPASFFGWAGVFRTPDQEIINRAGLDAYMFLRFLRKTALLFLILAIVCCGVLLPLHSINQGKGRGLEKYNFGNVTTVSRFWAHLVIIYFVTASILSLIYRELKVFVDLRRQYFMRPEHRMDDKACTILVMGIPREMYNVDDLKRFFDVFPGGVRKVWLNRYPKKLTNIVQDRDKLVNKLEGAVTNLIADYRKHEKKEGSSRNDADIENSHQIPETIRPKHREPFLIGSKVDSITAYRAELKKLNENIARRQHDPEKYSTPTRSAFIQFNNQLASQLATRVTIPRVANVAPDDIVWENLNRTHIERMIRKAVSIALVTALVLLWTIPVTFVASISKLDTLKEKIPFLEDILDSLPVSVIGIIQGVLPAVALAVLMILLPIILRFLSRFEGIVTHSGIAASLMGKYFFFLVVNVLLITTFATGIFSALPDLINNPSSAIDILATNLPKASTFFMTYVIVTYIGASLQLCQFGPLVVNWLTKKFLAKTPRQVWNHEKAMPAVDWGTTFPLHTLVANIGIVYAPIAPLIIPFVVVHFGLYYTAYLYNFLYVYHQPYDSGGRTFPRGLFQLFTGLFIMQLTMAGLLYLKQAFVQGSLTIVLMGLTVGALLTFRSYFKHDPTVEFLPSDLVVDFKKRPKNKEQSAETLDDDHYDNHMAQIEEIHADYTNEKGGDRDEQVDLPTRINSDPSDRFIFTHPALIEREPILWFPQDQAGVAEAEIKAAQAEGLRVSNEGAIFNANLARVEIDKKGPPEGRLYD